MDGMETLHAHSETPLRRPSLVVMISDRQLRLPWKDHRPAVAFDFLEKAAFIEKVDRGVSRPTPSSSGAGGSRKQPAAGKPAVGNTSHSLGESVPMKAAATEMALDGGTNAAPLTRERHGQNLGMAHPPR